MKVLELRDLAVPLEIAGFDVSSREAVYASWIRWRNAPDLDAVRDMEMLATAQRKGVNADWLRSGIARRMLPDR